MNVYEQPEGHAELVNKKQLGYAQGMLFSSANARITDKNSWRISEDSVIIFNKDQVILLCL